jgi:signal peptidase I
MIVFDLVIWLFAIVDSVLLTRINRQDYYQSSWNDRWFKYLGVIVGVILIHMAFGYVEESSLTESYKIPSGAMENTLLVGDYLSAKKCGADCIENGDILIFRYPNDPSIKYIKRCVAKGGQTIEIRNKELFVDGELTPLPELGKHSDNRIIPYNGGKWGISRRDNMPPMVIPEGHMFVLGDNRDNSADSRFWDFLDEDLVLGKAMFIHWSVQEKDPPQPAFAKYTYNLYLLVKHIRWERIGQKL